jgi:HEAT repeat protein
MRLLRLLSVFLIALLTVERGTTLAHFQDYRVRIESLLKKLNPSAVKEERNVLTMGPTTETQETVRADLEEIAAESAEARSQVIVALLEVLHGAAELRRVAFGTDHKWTAAVRVLGELRAIEAIDTLVRNLDQTGEFGVVSSIHYRPVCSAIRDIGEPAVPRLIDALAERESGISVLAASTLAEIGQPAIARLGEALHNGDAKTRGGAALALAWIGGDEAKASIERAIRIETDQDALKDMKYTATQVRRNSEK